MSARLSSHLSTSLDSDVDILVVRSARSEVAHAWRIDRSLARNFSVHLIVRTPKNMEWRNRVPFQRAIFLTHAGSLQHEPDARGLTGVATCSPKRLGDPRPTGERLRSHLVIGISVRVRRDDLAAILAANGPPDRVADAVLDEVN